MIYYGYWFGPGGSRPGADRLGPRDVTGTVRPSLQGHGSTVAAKSPRSLYRTDS
jgi:hypothetical protein